MKNFRKLSYILTLVAAVLFISSCADSYLDQEPGGSTITENQYMGMDNVTDGTAKGVYPLLYPYGGDHDLFAQRAIDMYGDLLCGDMAMKTFNYGWFRTDELMQTYTRRSYFWAYYYGIIRACNKGINAVNAKGIPPLDFDPKKITDEEYTMGLYYAQLMTMRGWAYAGLSRYFIEPDAAPTALAFPIYTELDTQGDTIIGAPRATAADVYLRIEEDLATAIDYFDAFDKIDRDSKIEVNIDVARISLAYSYLNKGEYANAVKYAKDAIDGTDAILLPKEEVLTTGFNNVDNKNWIWGQDVTVETTTALASFFGQCDIYSYSYASAGDVKGIDKNLYDEIQPWDIRKLWWNNYAQSSEKNASSFAYAPDGKFYSAKSKELQGDRDWLSDNIYMRLEVAYLIAAEASARNHNLNDARDFLYAITDLRVLDGQDVAYDDWKNNVVDPADEVTLLGIIKHNWRVEMWGEGYGLQTFRRYGEMVKLGDNHSRSKKEITPEGRQFTFELPTSELYYNPYIRQTDTKQLKHQN